jgi:hypothetical protein
MCNKPEVGGVISEEKLLFSLHTVHWDYHCVKWDYFVSTYLKMKESDLKLQKNQSFGYRIRNISRTFRTS